MLVNKNRYGKTEYVIVIFLFILNVFHPNYFFYIQVESS